MEQELDNSSDGVISPISPIEELDFEEEILNTAKNDDEGKIDNNEYNASEAADNAVNQNHPVKTEFVSNETDSCTNPPSPKRSDSEGGEQVNGFEHGHKNNKHGSSGTESKMDECEADENIDTEEGIVMSIYDNSMNKGDCDDDDKLLESDTGEISDNENADKNESERVADDGNCKDDDDGRQSESDTGEIEGDEEPNDLEEGEIKDSSPVAKKSYESQCRFFQRGSCIFGTQCQFRHVSSSVYKMLELVPAHQKFAPRNGPAFFRPPFFPPPVFFPNRPPDVRYRKNNMDHTNRSQYSFHARTDDNQPSENTWEKGLEQAKAMIQQANMRKRGYDVESPPKDKGDEQKDGKTNSKSSVAERFVQSFRENKNLYDRSRYEEKETSKEDWVDPWSRSKSKKRSRSLSSISPPHSRSCSSSSASSTLSSEDLYGSAFERKKSKSRSASPKKRASRERTKKWKSSRSSSRSDSRSPPRKKVVYSSSASRSRSRSSVSSQEKDVGLFGKKPLFSNRIIRMRKSRSPPGDPLKAQPPSRGQTSVGNRPQGKESPISDSESEATVFSYSSHSSASGSAGSHHSDRKTYHHSSTYKREPSKPYQKDQRQPSKPYQRDPPSKPYQKDNRYSSYNNEWNPPARSRSNVSPGKNDIMKRFISDANKVALGEGRKKPLNRDSANKDANKREDFGRKEDHPAKKEFVKKEDPISKKEDFIKKEDPPAKKGVQSNASKPPGKVPKRISSLANELMMYQGFSNSGTNNASNKSQSVKPATAKVPDAAAAAESETNAKGKIVLNLQPKTQPPLAAIAVKGKDCSSKRDMLLLQLKLVEDAIARKKCIS